MPDAEAAAGADGAGGRWSSLEAHDTITGYPGCAALLPAEALPNWPRAAACLDASGESITCHGHGPDWRHDQVGMFNVFTPTPALTPHSDPNPKTALYRTACEHCGLHLATQGTCPGVSDDAGAV